MTHYVPLIILIGLPGSGKSTWARQFVETHPTYQMVSTDHIRQQLYGDETVQGQWPEIWRTVQQQWQMGITAIQTGTLQGVIYDATNARRRSRRTVITTARQAGFTHLTACWFDVPLGVCLRRNHQRQRQVPDSVIYRMHRQLYGALPSTQEGFDEIIRLLTTPWTAVSVVHEPYKPEVVCSNNPKKS